MAEIERMAALCMKDLDDEEIGDDDLDDDDLLVTYLHHFVSHQCISCQKHNITILTMDKSFFRASSNVNLLLFFVVYDDKLYIFGFLDSTKQWSLRNCDGHVVNIFFLHSP